MWKASSGRRLQHEMLLDSEPVNMLMHLHEGRSFGAGRTKTKPYSAIELLGCCAHQGPLRRESTGDHTSKIGHESRVPIRKHSEVQAEPSTESNKPLFGVSEEVLEMPCKLPSRAKSDTDPPVKEWNVKDRI